MALVRGVFDVDRQQVLVPRKSRNVEGLADFRDDPIALIVFIAIGVLLLLLPGFNPAVDDLKAAARLNSVAAPAEPDVEIDGPAGMLITRSDCSRRLIH